MNELTHFRNEIDQFMGFHPQSPLDHEQRANFDGLAYFEPNEALVMVLPVEKFAATEPMIEMETSTGEQRPYRRYGRISFEVDGEPASLIIYSDIYGQEFFLPFRDATSGKETYGAGRYLDNHRPGLVALADGRIKIDFNFAYNPYCAYSPQYSCPLPPRENWLTVPIQAGEKNFNFESH
ncbi:DUF1684 domain-containing protein [Candidatus Leptofilum sp.]|uniref:DUF1684 domain-containing protein n=1 Tax=Candidatus Leptofilum sp. TaxID=3241576 RepID=UPI003B5A3EA4